MSLPLRGGGEVVANPDEGGGNRRLVLRVPGWPGFEPGQFAMLSPGVRSAARRDDPLLPRPMAVYRQGSRRRHGDAKGHGSPNGQPSEGGYGSEGGHGDGGESAVPEIEVLYKVVGRGTALLAEARVGETVDVVGPLGRGFPLPEPPGPALLVGGGTGIASLYELAVRAAARGPVRVLLGARREVDLMGRGDFEALDVDLRIATEDGSAGHRGRVTELLAAALAEVGTGAGEDGGPARGTPATVYACGPTPMMREAARLAAGAGARAWVSLENPMACGFGVCLGCAAPRAGGGFALVCRDGPVFEAAGVDWERLA